MALKIFSFMYFNAKQELHISPHHKCYELSSLIKAFYFFLYFQHTHKLTSAHSMAGRNGHKLLIFWIQSGSLLFARALHRCFRHSMLDPFDTSTVCSYICPLEPAYVQSFESWCFSVLQNNLELFSSGCRVVHIRRGAPCLPPEEQAKICLTLQSSVFLR